MKNILVFISVLLSSNCFGDTLKLHFIGYFFKHETYKIYYDSFEYTKKTAFGTDAFAINIVIADSIKNGERINVSVYRKGFFQFKYHNTKCELYYDDKKRFAVYYRDIRFKNKYSFDVYFTDCMYILSKGFWENGPIPKYAEVDRIKRIK